MINIQSILETNGPMLSSEIKKVLIESNGLSDEAARKQISRVKGIVRKLKSFTFPKNEGFLFLNSQYKTPIFYEKLYAALLRTNSTTGNTIAAISCLSGIVSIEKFNIIAGAIDSAKRKSIEKVKKELLSVEYIRQEKNSLGDDVIVLQQMANPIDLSYDTIAIIEEVILAVMQDWIRKNGLGSFNKILRNSEFAGYYWDITAPTYLLPFIDVINNTVKPGFVIVDILPQINIRDEHVKYYVSKISSISAQRNIRPFLPMIIGLSFSTTAFNLLKKEGILVTTVANLIGDESSKLLNDMIDVINNANQRIRESNNEQLTTILRGISKYEGKFNNLKSHLFEMLTGNILYSIKNCFIEMNRKIHVNGIRLAEIDIICIIGKTDIWIIECKAYSSLIDERKIIEWENKIGVIYEWLKSNPENNEKRILFEFWSSSGFTETAQKMLIDHQKSLRKYTISWKDRESIIELCKENRLNSQQEILREYF